MLMQGLLFYRTGNENIIYCDLTDELLRGRDTSEQKAAVDGRHRSSPTLPASHLPPRSILDRLGNVRRLNLLAAGQIRNRARQLEHAVISPRAQVQLLHTCTCAASAGVAALIRFLPPSSTQQNWRISAGPISALHAMAVPSKRRRWISRAASTRARTTALGSPNRSSDSFSYLTAGTSTWMSIPKGGCACGP